MKVGRAIAYLTVAVSSAFFDEFSLAADKVESTGLTASEESRIYGGTEADIEEFPFLASLRDTFLGETFCSGTLITPRFILTAGHCIRTEEMDIVAYFGTNMSTGSESELVVPIVEGFRHPRYVKKTHLYDVGLLKLEKPVKRKRAKLCARDGSDNEVGTKALVLGWGKTENRDTTSPVLEQLQLPIISNERCGRFKKYKGRITDGMLCAGTGDGKDTCNGDSGGPLLVDGDILIGCVSWGSKCGEQAGVFTRLTYVMDYIDDILSGGDGSKFNVATSKDDESDDDSNNSDAAAVPSSKRGHAPKSTEAEATVNDKELQDLLNELSAILDSGSNSHEQTKSTRNLDKKTARLTESDADDDDKSD